jgi:hypothetical protein
MNEQQFSSLPLEQRKIAQKRLIDLGLYNGAADGKWGAGTKAAFELEAKRAKDDAKAAEDAKAQQRADDLRGQELAIKRIEAEGGKAATDAAAAEAAAQTARKQRYDNQASSGLGMATQSAANLAAPAAGTALGMALGAGVNRQMDRAQESRNTVLRGAAEDRMAGRTTVEGARTGARLSGAMPYSNSAARVASRMAPNLGLGALSIAKGAQVLSQSDPDGEFYPQMADRAAGLAYIGTGAGLAKQGWRYGAAPGVAPDAQSIAVINSNQLRRNGVPGAAGADSRPIIDLTAEEVRPAQAQIEGPEKVAAAPGSKAYLQQQAKDLGIKGVSKLNKAQLAEALAKSVADHGAKRTVAKRLPKPPGGAAGAAGLAGGLAYALTPDRADAATGEPTGDQSEALTNAAIAGGGAWSVSKLAQALMPSARAGLSMAGDAMAPVSIDSMTDYTPDEMAQGRNTLARNLPAFLRGGAVEDAYQMAQLPERNPERGQEPAYYDAPSPPAEAAPEPSIDWDAAIAAKGPMLDRISQDQMRQIATALASQGVAGRGDAFPAQQPQDEQTRRLAEALMGAY